MKKVLLLVLVLSAIFSSGYSLIRDNSTFVNSSLSVYGNHGSSNDLFDVHLIDIDDEDTNCPLRKNSFFVQPLWNTPINILEPASRVSSSEYSGIPNVSGPPLFIFFRVLRI